MTVASQVKQSLATLKSIHATLRIYAEQLETQNLKAKMMYSQNAEKLKNLLERLEPYLLR